MKWKIVFILLIAFCSIQTSFAQKANKKIKIMGIVVDANRKPVEGAIIFVDNVKTDVVTNAEGSYSIKALPTAKTLTALSLYGEIKEMEINGNTVVNFMFDRISTKTSDAPINNNSEVVDVGYGSAKKDQTATNVATSKVDANSARTKSYSDIFEMIKNELPGVQVVGTSIQIQQGSGSLTSNTEPLYVLDGTIVNQISNVVPSQVSSISVLKGPAASIYGARGANGVIVITSIK
jgi:TonB-dependent starch-binding outer membrane protein SusC